MSPPGLTPVTCGGGTQPVSGTLTGSASNGTFNVTDGWFSITGSIAGTTGEFVRGTASEQYDFINDFGERPLPTSR